MAALAHVLLAALAFVPSAALALCVVAVTQ
jgi:hypothetical protein